MTSDGPVSFISVQRYVRYCCITHNLSPGVKNNFKKIGHINQVGTNCKVTENKRFNNALLRD